MHLLVNVSRGSKMAIVRQLQLQLHSFIRASCKPTFFRRQKRCDYACPEPTFPLMSRPSAQPETFSLLSVSPLLALGPGQATKQTASRLHYQRVAGALSGATPFVPQGSGCPSLRSEKLKETVAVSGFFWKFLWNKIGENTGRACPESRHALNHRIVALGGKGKSAQTLGQHRHNNCPHLL